MLVLVLARVQLIRLGLGHQNHENGELRTHRGFLVES